MFLFVSISIYIRHLVNTEKLENKINRHDLLPPSTWLNECIAVYFVSSQFALITSDTFLGHSYIPMHALCIPAQGYTEQQLAPVRETD